jgi:hypothetical protein
VNRRSSQELRRAMLRDPSEGSMHWHELRTTDAMAAVFALVFVPALAAVLCLGGAHGHASFATIAAGGMFITLVAGVLGVLFRLSRQWEGEGDVKEHV